MKKIHLRERADQRGKLFILDPDSMSSYYDYICSKEYYDRLKLSRQGRASSRNTTPNKDIGSVKTPPDQIKGNEVTLAYTTPRVSPGDWRTKSSEQVKADEETLVDYLQSTMEDQEPPPVDRKKPVDRPPRPQNLS